MLQDLQTWSGVLSIIIIWQLVHRNLEFIEFFFVLGWRHTALQDLHYLRRKLSEDSCRRMDATSLDRMVWHALLDMRTVDSKSR